MLPHNSAVSAFNHAALCMRAPQPAPPLPHCGHLDVPAGALEKKVAMLQTLLFEALISVGWPPGSKLPHCQIGTAGHQPHPLDELHFLTPPPETAPPTVTRHLMAMDAP